MSFKVWSEGQEEEDQLEGREEEDRGQEVVSRWGGQAERTKHRKLQLSLIIES